MGFSAAVKEEFLQQLDPGLRCYEGVYHQIREMSNKFTRFFNFNKFDVIFMTSLYEFKLH
jgi:hypothetical protein